MPLSMDIVVLKYGVTKRQRNALYWMDLCYILSPGLPRDLIDSGRNKYTKPFTSEGNRRNGRE